MKKQKKEGSGKQKSSGIKVFSNYLIKYKKEIFFVLIIWLVIVGLFQFFRTPEDGINYESKEYLVSEEEIKFLKDYTYMNPLGKRVSNQEIFDKIFYYIDNSEKYILIDMFLFNSHMGKSRDEPYRYLASELTARLISKKKKNPEIKIDFITDEINTAYGGAKSREIEALKEAGINVIITDLTKLRDSNYLYSVVWRTFIQWLGNSDSGGFMPHPFSSYEKGVSIRSYLKLLNFKANHRKTFLADYNNSAVAIIMSANPHDGSSAHSNVAFEIHGDFYSELYNTESYVAKFSGEELSKSEIIKSYSINHVDRPIKIKLITEKKIKDSLIKSIDSTKDGDKISLAMFYLSERDVINSLIDASKRGVDVRLILDPNKDAFGYEKNGIPNRAVASELIKKSDGKIKIRWYNTNKEQFHTKMIIIESENKTIIILGSANLTKRNIGNYNLETNVIVNSPSELNPAKETREYFEKLWDNEKGIIYTLDYSEYEDASFLKWLCYMFQEYSGLGSF